MPATITSAFRKNNALDLVTDISTSSAKYYIGIGKSDSWTGETVSGFSAPTPSTADRDAVEALNNLIAIKRVATTNPGLVIPAFTWASGSRYKQYDPYDDSCFYQETVGSNTYNPCYIITGDKVYLCVRSGVVGDSGTPGSDAAVLAPSTVQPTTTAINTLDSGSDNYRWAYLYTLTAGDSLNTALFKRVPTAINTGDTTGLRGAIIGYRVVSSGSGYAAGTTTVTISGDGTGATVTASTQLIIVGGGIVGIKNPGSASAYGSNYTSAQVTITSTGAGTGAVIVPIISPRYGYAYDCTAVLPCWFAGLSVAFDPSQDLDHLINVNDYRQISLIKDPATRVGLTFSAFGSSKTIADISVGGVFTYTNGARGVVIGIDTKASPNVVYIKQSNIGHPVSTGSFSATNVTTYTPPTGTAFTATISTVTAVSSSTESYSALKYLQYSSNVTALSSAGLDKIIFQSSTGAKAYVAYYDSANFRLYYHQNNTSSVNTIPFAQSGTSSPITVDGASISTAYTCNMCPEYAPQTGSIQFLENRKAISRAQNQSEDIKLVVQF